MGLDVSLGRDNECPEGSSAQCVIRLSAAIWPSKGRRSSMQRGKPSCEMI